MLQLTAYLIFEPNIKKRHSLLTAFSQDFLKVDVFSSMYIK